MFAESWARPLLIVHTILAVAAVGAATHTVLWLRLHLRRGGRRGALRRFGWLTFGLYAATFLIGVVLYPTYRTRVRAELLDDPVAMTAQVRATAIARAARTPDAAPLDEEKLAAEADATVAAAGRAAHWFDVKEYLALLGMLAALAVALALHGWHDDGGPAIGGIVVGLALVAAATGWIAGIVGLLTVMWRAV